MIRFAAAIFLLCLSCVAAIANFIGVAPVPALQETVGTVYYVACSGGNDNSAGTSPTTAWATIGKAATTTLNPGDRVLLQGSGACSHAVTSVSGGTNGASFARVRLLGTAENPVILGSYGGRCATVVDSGNGLTISISGGYFIIRDLCLDGGGTAQSGIAFQQLTTGFLFGNAAINNRITNYSAAFGTGGVNGIRLGGFGTNGFSDWKIIGNTIDGTGGTFDRGIFVSSGSNPNGLIQGNVVHHITGRAGAASGQSGSPIQVKDAPNVRIRWNVGHTSGQNANTCGGPVGIWVSDVDGAIIEYNEAYGMGPTVFSTGCDWDAFDLDQSVTNSIIQYNYGHDNWGACLLAFTTNSKWGNNIFRYNVCENNANTVGAEEFGCITIGSTSGTSPPSGTSYIYGNTCVSNGPVSAKSGVVRVFNNQNGFVVFNNILCTLSGQLLVYAPSVTTGNIKFYGNDYCNLAGTFAVRWGASTHATLAAWRAAAVQEVLNAVNTGITSNPLLTSAGNGGTCGVQAGFGPQPCPSADKLQTGSPAIGTGLAPGAIGIGFPARGYYADCASPHVTGTGYNIGADACAR